MINQNEYNRSALPVQQASVFPGFAQAGSGNTFYSGFHEDPEKKKKEIQAKRKKRRRKEFLSFILRSIFLIVVLYILFFHIVGLLIAPNSDMYPRIDGGDMVLYYRLEDTIHAQDVIAFYKTEDQLDVTNNTAGLSFDFNNSSTANNSTKSSYLKNLTDKIGKIDMKIKTVLKKQTVPENSEIFISRVVATPGDTVEINENEKLVINGNIMIESGIFYSTPEYLGFVQYPITLQEGEYFVLADQRQGGADSRFFGPVSKEEILGTVITIVRRNNL